MTNWEKVQFNTEDWGTYRVKDIEVDALNEVLAERLEASGINPEEIQDEDLEAIEEIKDRIWEEYPIERTSEMKDWRLYFEDDAYSPGFHHDPTYRWELYADEELMAEGNMYECAEWDEINEQIMEQLGFVPDYSI